MYKKILATSMVTATLLFVGCGEDSTSCRFEVQNDLDTGNFDAAISALEGACATAFTQSDRYFNLASAYMGKSGFGAIDVVSIMLDSDNGNDDAFASFTKSVGNSASDSSLAYLDTAKKYYLLSVNPDLNLTNVNIKALCDANVTSGNSRMENACFYIGFNQTFQATTTITYLTKDVDTLVESINNDQNNTPLDMQASLYALALATDGNYTLPNNSNITATAVTIMNSPYAHLKVNINDSSSNLHTFYRLAKNTTRDANSTVITHGYCTSDGNRTACEGIENPDGSINDLTKACYACPVVTDGNNTQDIAQLLVDTLNGGTDVLGSVSDDQDIKDSIADFKEDITGSRDGNVTLDKILDYLNK